MGAYKNYFLVFFIISSILSFLSKNTALVLELIASRNVGVRFKIILIMAVFFLNEIW